MAQAMLSLIQEALGKEFDPKAQYTVGGPEVARKWGARALEVGVYDRARRIWQIDRDGDPDAPKAPAKAPAAPKKVAKKKTDLHGGKR